MGRESGMLEGMSASCVIHVEEADHAILIPSAAIRESKGSTYVYTSKDSKGNLAGKTKVSTGLSNGTQVQITSGLSEGDTVYYTVTETDSSSSKSDSSSAKNGSIPSGGPGRNGGSKS
ncbi:membrane-fusion protein [Clostridium sp. SY8519]|nr:membrane-fusion protein [Clostridium sp. SY8519]